MKGGKSPVSQGWVPGSVFCNLFLNHLDLGVNSEVTKFVDNIKLLRELRAREGCEELRRDLSTLDTWTSAWQMKFKMGKCKVMHSRAKTPKYKYILLGSELTVTDQERVLGLW